MIFKRWFVLFIIIIIFFLGIQVSKFHIRVWCVSKNQVLFNADQILRIKRKKKRNKQYRNPKENLKELQISLPSFDIMTASLYILVSIYSSSHHSNHKTLCIFSIMLCFHFRLNINDSWSLSFVFKSTAWTCLLVSSKIKQMSEDWKNM